MNKNIGIDFSTGSLGMGLSIGIGVALANKKKGTDHKTFVILGDGECNEGSVWEAAMAAPNFGLNNLYAIIDNNKFQQTGSNKEIMNSESLKEKWKSFGWETSEIDGHNIDDLYNYFETSKKMNKPKALSALEFKNKVTKIFIHGFLHLLGFDHIKLKDFKKMLIEEEKIYKTIETKIVKLV